MKCVVCVGGSAVLYLLTADYGGRYRKIISSLHSLHGNRGFPIKSVKQSLFDTWWKSEEFEFSSGRRSLSRLWDTLVYLVLSGGGWWASRRTASGHF